MVIIIIINHGGDSGDKMLPTGLIHLNASVPNKPRTKR